MSHEKVVALYDTAAHADAAVNKLKSAGYSAHDIRVIRNENDALKAGLNEPGFWHGLSGHEIEPDDVAAVGGSAVHGGVVVSVRVPESEAKKVIALLDGIKPVDVLGPPRVYGSPGAQPVKVGVPPPTSAPTLRPQGVKPVDVSGARPVYASPGLEPVSVTEPPLTSAASLRNDEELVRLAEEQLSVGKRQVEAGITRVRRFVVEKPVEACVTLHEEHAEIMRKAISDPTYIRDIDWSDQVVEITETVEKPVVSKTVRVAEEVVIRRKGSDHVETVHDTVRRQQLDVERVPAATAKR